MPCGQFQKKVDEVNAHLKEICAKKDIAIIGAELEGREGGGLPCPFLKLKEKCPDFGKKYPN